MPATEKDGLFTLIRSMDKNEKGYFKKFAGLNGQKTNSVYLRLFDCMNRMETYNLAVIKEEFKGEKVLKHLTVSKFYLKNLVMRALRNFHEEGMHENYYLRAIQDINLLRGKGKVEWAFSVAEKALDRAMLEESFAYALILFRHYHVLYTQTGRGSLNIKRLAEEQQVIAQIENEAVYRHLLQQLVQIIYDEQHTLQQKTTRDKLQAIINHPYLKDDKKALSKRTRFLSLHLKTLYYTQIEDDFKQSEKYFKAAIAFYKSNEAPLRQLELTFNQLNISFINFYTSNSKFDEAWVLLNEFEHRILTSQSLQPLLAGKVRELIINARIQNLVESAQYKKAIEYANTVLTKQKHVLQGAAYYIQFNFDFWLALSHWHTGDLKNALQLSSALLEKDTNLSVGIPVCNKFLYLLIQYDMGNYPTLANFISRHKRWLKQMKLQNELSDKFAAMMLALCKSGKEKAQTLKVFRTYENAFEPTNNDQHLVYSTLKLPAWIKQKKGKPL